jgi:hypothetical protein
MKADILTKAFPRPRFKQLVKMIGMGKNRLNHYPWGSMKRKSGGVKVNGMDMMDEVTQDMKD